MEKEQRLAREVAYLEGLHVDGADQGDVPGLLQSIAVTLTLVVQELGELTRTLATGGGDFPLTELAAMVASGEAREIRKKAGLTQAGIGSLLGVDDSTVSSWENGEWFPSQASSRRYLAVLRELERDA